MSPVIFGLLAALSVNSSEIRYIDRPQSEEKSIYTSCGEINMRLSVLNNFKRKWDWQTELGLVEINSVDVTHKNVEELGKTIEGFSEVKGMAVRCARGSENLLLEVHGIFRKEKTGDLWPQIEKCQKRGGMWIKTGKVELSLRQEQFITERYVGPSCRVINASAIMGNEQ